MSSLYSLLFILSLLPGARTFLPLPSLCTLSVLVPFPHFFPIFVFFSSHIIFLVSGRLVLFPSLFPLHDRPRLRSDTPIPPLHHVSTKNPF